MNTITTFDLSAYFYNAKREKFLRNYHQNLMNYKWFSGYGDFLTDEQERERKERSIRAIELASKIASERLMKMKADGVINEMNKLETQFIK